MKLRHFQRITLAFLMLAGCSPTGELVRDFPLPSQPVDISNQVTPSTTAQTPQLSGQSTNLSDDGVTEQANTVQNSFPQVTPTINRMYVVAWGDTISSIAEFYGIDFIFIMLFNGLHNDSVLSPGDVLSIPNQVTNFPTPTALPEYMTEGYEIKYLVLPGDTIDSIAEEFNNSVEEIRELNDLSDSENIFAGQLLIIAYHSQNP